jgi:hypothetical protein
LSVLSGMIPLLVFGAVSTGVFLVLQRFLRQPQHERGVFQQSLDQWIPPNDERSFRKAEPFGKREMNHESMTSPDQNIVSGKPSVQDAWYYADENGKFGPLSLQGLRETLATLPHDVLVWHPGLQDWKPAKDISELNEGETALPPPLPKIAGATGLEGQGAAAARPNVTLAGLSPLLILGLIAFGGWAYFGFPSPVTLMNWSSAEQECVKFAKENQNKGKLFDYDKIIKATGSWIKNGKNVVEIGAFQHANDTTYTPRICVIGGGRIEIVSILENNVWR